MKKVVLITGVFAMMMVLSACKKEVIQLNDSKPYVETNSTNDMRVTSANEKTVKDTSTVEGDGITDPNDDDFIKKPKKIKIRIN